MYSFGCTFGLRLNHYGSCSHSVTGALQMAIYFCTGEMAEGQWRHYALNVGQYTHFKHAAFKDLRSKTGKNNVNVQVSGSRQQSEPSRWFPQSGSVS